MLPQSSQPVTENIWFCRTQLNRHLSTLHLKAETDPVSETQSSLGNIHYRTGKVQKPIDR